MSPPNDPLEAARTLAVEGLAFIANDKECLSSFLTSSGLDPANIREVAAETGFLAGTLDYLMHNESLLISFATHCGVSPEEVASAHRTLAGPPVWD